MNILIFFISFFKDMFINIISLEFICYFCAAFAALSLFGFVFRFLQSGEY